MQCEHLHDQCSCHARLLQRTDWFTQEKACRLLTAVLESRPDKSVRTQAPLENGHAEPSEGPSSAAVAEAEGVQTQLAMFVDWLCSQLRC